MAKITIKAWLAKIAATLTHRTSLLHRISSLGLFYSKTKIKQILSFYSSFGVLTFTFDMHVWITYLFCIIKNNENNAKCTTEGEKSSKCCLRNHTIFVHLKGTAQVAVISLFILRENSLRKREILDKNLFEMINQLKFLFTTLKQKK